MERFHIVVFNFERIGSFLQNFDKIRNFRADRDRVYVFDCSDDFTTQQQALTDFAAKHGWKLGQEVHFVRRRNWGIDQGARVDYLKILSQLSNKPKYIWQFQEHYLDLNSEWSRWSSEIPDVAGQLKADTIPDNLEIDLDYCAEVYEENADVAIIYADRAKLGVFTHKDGRQWFYTDGANFCMRASHALETFKPEVLASYKMIYDGSYQWALFIELDIGHQLTKSGEKWFDLITRHSFEHPDALKRLEVSGKVRLHQNAEDFYLPLYSDYEQRYLKAINKSSLFRSVQIFASQIYLRITTHPQMTRHMRPVAHRLGLASLGQRMRSHLTGAQRR